MNFYEEEYKEESKEGNLNIKEEEAKTKNLKDASKVDNKKKKKINH